MHKRKFSFCVTRMPQNDIYLLSLLRILMQVLPHVNAQKKKRKVFKDFKFQTLFFVLFLSDGAVSVTMRRFFFFFFFFFFRLRAHNQRVDYSGAYNYNYIG